MATFAENLRSAIKIALHYLSTNGSAIVAIFALTIATWQAYISLAEARHSVRPLLYAYTDFSDEANPIGIILENQGIGPAIIRETSIYFNNQFVGSINEEHWNQLIQKKTPIRFSFESFPQNSSIPTEKKIPLLVISDKFRKAIEDDKNKPEAFNRIKNDVRIFTNNELRITIRYCSLYNECWNLNFKNGKTSTEEI